jgi:4-amino-4-deoxy-L-arabinose transferase-like glycosyltransferase
VEEKVFNRYPSRILLVGILILVTIFYVTTIRSGHIWDGDFGMYVKHAINLVEGKEYHDTGYIYAGDGLSPRNYPPVYPMLLAPVYKLFGLNLTAMKMENILLFVLSLAVIYQLFKKELSSGYLLSLIAIVGFSPYFWQFKDQVLSEFSFIFFLYLAFYFITKQCLVEGTWKTNPLSILLAGLVVYMAVGVRTIGLSLVITIFILDLIQRKKITLFSLSVSAVVGLCLFLQKFVLMEGGTGQFAQFTISGAQIIKNLLYYLEAFSQILFYGWNEFLIDNKLFRLLILIPLSLAFSLLALLGFIAKIKKEITLLEIFPLVYLTVLILWPYLDGTRFIAPVYPLFLYYIFYSIQTFNLIQAGETKRVLLITMTSSIAIFYLSFYWTADYGPITPGINNKESVEVFEFVKNNTDENDIIIFRKPRILTLYTGRSASYNKRIDDNESFIEFLKTLEASYVVVGFLDSPLRRELVEKNKAQLNKVFSNSDFSVYKTDKPFKAVHLGPGGMKD